MIKLATIAEIAKIHFAQWLKETTLSQMIALGLGTAMVVGIVSYGGYTLYNTQTGGAVVTTQNQQETKTTETNGTATLINTTPVTEVVTPYVETAPLVDPNTVVESNATTVETVTTEGVDYYNAPDGGRTEYIEETPTYTEPTYSEPTYSEPTYTAPAYTEPTYTAPVATAPANDWGSDPVGDTSGDWGAGGESN